MLDFRNFFFDFDKVKMEKKLVFPQKVKYKTGFWGGGGTE